MSARFLQRIGCFHSDVDFGVTTHLPPLGLHVATEEAVEREQLIPTSRKARLRSGLGRHQPIPLPGQVLPLGDGLHALD